MTGLRRRDFVAGAAATLTIIASRAGAQDRWPTRPVHFIVPLAPGGGIDFIARQVGDVLTKTLGQQVVVENRTGAGGALGMDLAMKSDPDGYTVLITNDNAASAPHIMSLPHDYTKELVPVVYLGRQSQIMAVHSSLPVKTVAEFVTYAKANPGLGFATSGVGSNQHVLGEWFKRETGARIDHVPYRGAGQAINDLVAAHVTIAFLGSTALKPHADTGTLRLLAQSNAVRSPVLKEVPTFEEAGLKGLVLEPWFGAFVPKGTPQPIIARLNRDMNNALKDAKLVENLNKNGIEIGGGSEEDLGKLAQADSAKYARLVKDLGIKVGSN
jgi:tripartite-type tricarboxylate transporter receptor subunit TctC